MVMKILALCLSAGALVLAGGAAARTSTPTPATPGTTVVTAPAKVKRVCRERGRAGSHITNVVCKTPEEWAALQADVDDQDEYGIPGNKTATGRAINRSPLNRSSGPARGGATN
jgi:hypothetical protein